MKSLFISLCLLFGATLLVNAQNVADNSEEVFIVAQEPPYIPGGFENFYKTHIEENLNYPEEAKKANIKGKVYVQFYINEDGSISDVTVARGIGYGCDQEAVRLIKLSPKWKPAKKNGKPIRERMVLPVSFGY